MTAFPQQEVLRLKAKHNRQIAKALLVESAMMLAEARLLDEGIENPSPELIKQEAQGTRPSPPPLKVDREEAHADMAKYLTLSKKQDVYLMQDGERVAVLSCPQRPLGPGFDLDSSEEIW
jgi:hypothetical protein